MNKFSTFDDPQNFAVALFRLPFRPFFLGAGIFAVISILLWSSYWMGMDLIKPVGGALWWHGHEMIFGFAAAVLLGFLLTAAKNWTGLTGLGGWPLILLFFLWLIPRFAYLSVGQTSVWIALISESLFWLLGCYFYSRMIIKKRMWRNLGFSIILLALGAVNFALVMSATDGGNWLKWLHVGVVFFMVVITIIGGRIIPFFSAAASGLEKVEGRKLIELPVIALSILLLGWSLVAGIISRSAILGAICALLTLFQLARFIRWPLLAGAGNAMLWTLFLGYACLIAGIASLAAYHFGVLDNLSSIVHLITIGAIGLMILSMMSRVSLGHTGRKISAGRLLVVAFTLVIISALVRVLFPLAGLYLNLAHAHAYALAAVIWSLGYLLWLIKFTPILIRKRADGRPG